MSHNADLLRSIDNGGQFTTEEHAYVIEQASAASFVSQRELVKQYLTESHGKLTALDFAMEVASDNGATRLLSLGAGQCVLEWLLEMALPETGFVVATDFDPYFVRKADEVFPELRTTTFDFFNDEVSELVAQIGAPVDIAVFFGSAYVMDDATFVQLFAQLRKAGIPRIIDFHAGATSLGRLVKQAAAEYLASKPTVRRLARKPATRDYRVKFHGYQRDFRSICKLYASAGWEISEEHTWAHSYPYTAVLDAT